MLVAVGVVGFTYPEHPAAGQDGSDHEHDHATPWHDGKGRGVGNGAVTSPNGDFWARSRCRLRLGIVSEYGLSRY